MVVVSSGVSIVALDSPVVGVHEILIIESVPWITAGSVTVSVLQTICNESGRLMVLQVAGAQAQTADVSDTRECVLVADVTVPHIARPV